MPASPHSLHTIPNHRLAHLDALRGIAAFIVVIHHAMLSLAHGTGILRPLDHWPGLGLVALGRPVVILFFVLSGFVLTLCLRGGKQSTPIFALRRLCRLLPPYWVAILFSATAFALVPHHTAHAMSSWFNAQWGHEPDSLPLVTMIDHMLMLAGPTQYPLDHVAWSLVHELRLSLVLPVFIVMVSRCGLVTSLVTAAIFSVGADTYAAMHPATFPRGFHGFLFDAQGLGYSLVLSARFWFAFALGSTLAMRLSIFSKLLERRGMLLPVACAALIGLCQTNEFVMSGSAALLIGIVAISERLARCLDIAPLSWLGRVSYSLYLVHLPIMLTCGLLLDGILPAPITLGLAVSVSLLVADAMCRLVENPCIRWGRAIATSLAARPQRRISATARVAATLP